MIVADRQRTNTVVKGESPLLDILSTKNINAFMWRVSIK